ncbi:hypothetical protein ACVWYG_000823 [Pedobacter sp. UYEF25]
MNYFMYYYLSVGLISLGGVKCKPIFADLCKGNDKLNKSIEVNDMIDTLHLVFRSKGPSYLQKTSDLSNQANIKKNIILFNIHTKVLKTFY